MDIDEELFIELIIIENNSFSGFLSSWTTTHLKVFLSIRICVKYE
jgi:hypothetical protein